MAFHFLQKISTTKNIQHFYTVNFLHKYTRSQNSQPRKKYKKNFDFDSQFSILDSRFSIAFRVYNSYLTFIEKKHMSGFI